MANANDADSGREMPLLRKEPSISSAEIFSLPGDAHPWWVAHVRSRAEKMLARRLAAASMPFFLPQSEQVVRRAGRNFVSYLPLFPGYVFFRGGREARDAAFASGVVATLVEVPDQRQLDEELRQIYDLQAAGASLVPFRDMLPGDPVRIVDGAFRGYTGVVLHDRSHDRLVVTLSLIQKQIEVEFPRDMLAAER